MDITNRDIDGGKPFDWGKTSQDYARFRDIYPREFYQKIIDCNLCINEQSVLDIWHGCRLRIKLQEPAKILC